MTLSNKDIESFKKEMNAIKERNKRASLVNALLEMSERDDKNGLFAKQILKQLNAKTSNK